MRLIIDHFEQFGYVGMIKLSPNFNLLLNFIVVMDHLHLSFCIITNGSFTFKRWLVHYFHCKLHFFLLIVLLLLTSPNYSFHFAEATLSNTIHNLKLVYKLFVAFYSNRNFVCVIHAVTRFEKLIIS